MFTHSPCDTCRRPVLESGIVAVEAARQQDGTHEVLINFEALEGSEKEADRERYYDIVARLEQFATQGRLEQPRKFRPLHTREGLWEIKTAEDRVGCYVREADQRHSLALRLTHQWPKSANKTADGKTPNKQKNFGDRIIREDRSFGN